MSPGCPHGFNVLTKQYVVWAVFTVSLKMSCYRTILQYLFLLHLLWKKALKVDHSYPVWFLYLLEEKSSFSIKKRVLAL